MAVFTLTINYVLSENYPFTGGDFSKSTLFHMKDAILRKLFFGGEVINKHYSNFDIVYLWQVKLI